MRSYRLTTLDNNVFKICFVFGYCWWWHEIEGKPWWTCRYNVHNNIYPAPKNKKKISNDFITIQWSFDSKEQNQAPIPTKVLSAIFNEVHALPRPVSPDLPNEVWHFHCY